MATMNSSGDFRAFLRNLLLQQGNDLCLDAMIKSVLKCYTFDQSTCSLALELEIKTYLTI